MRVPGFTATAALTTQHRTYFGSAVGAARASEVLAASIPDYLIPHCPLGTQECLKRDAWGRYYQGCCVYSTHFH